MEQTKSNYINIKIDNYQNENPLRILIAGTTYYPAANGQSVFTTRLAEGLARRGHTVMAVTQSDRKTAYHKQLNGVDVVALKSISLNLWYPGAYLTLFAGRSVQDIFKKFRPNIVHIQDHYPLSWDVFKVAQKRHVRVVGTNHFMPENLAPYLQSIAWFKPGFNRLLWRWMLTLYNRFDAVTAPSQTAAEILVRAGLTAPVFPVSCGVDLQHFHPDPCLDRAAYRRDFGLDPQKTLFLFIGRVDREKKLDLLLRAFRQVKREDVQLAVAGKGSVMGDLMKLSSELKLQDRVRFLGYVPDEKLPGLISSADVFAMPSEAELLSIATLEAMACARPVLAADSQALPELVDPGKNGYLFQPGEVDDAARYIELMADQKIQWAGMQDASLKKVQAHNLEATLKRYEEIYRSIL